MLLQAQCLLKEIVVHLFCERMSPAGAGAIFVPIHLQTNVRSLLLSTTGVLLVLLLL